MTTFLAGQRLTADALNGIRTDGAWTPWSVAFTANFTKGNATDLSGYYRSGNLVVARMYLAIGSTTVVGNLPVFTLPVAATTSQHGGGQITTYRDVSASAEYEGILRVAGNASGYILVRNVAGANDIRTGIAATVPFTWAAGDIISGYLTYEAA